MSLPCANCDGGVCTECVLEHQERGGGDQGLSALELEVFSLRNDVRRLTTEKLAAEVAAADAPRAPAAMKRERDAALESLAMFTGEARA